jgi:hypothetical protein
MNNTVTGLSKTIPKNLTDLFSSLCGEVCLIREQWQMYETLYGQEANCNLLNKSAPMFFWMVDYLFIDNFILALCRLGDSAEQRIRTDIVKNFTFRQLLSQLEQEPKSHASLIQSLTPLLADYQTKCEALRAQRNKRVSHTDYDTKMAPNKNPLPDYQGIQLNAQL